MSTRLYTTCTDCGWRGGPYRTRPQADYAHSRHSCEKARRDRAAYERGMAREAAVDRTPKSCLHKRANHQHGTRACYVLDVCRCVPCAAANSTYEGDRARRIAYGQQAYVDARPATDHVRALCAAGLGWKRVAALAGVPASTIYPLLYGKADRNGGAPRTKARRATVEAILAVPMPNLDQLGDGANVDSTGTRRRLQALIYSGWSVQRLADTAGVDRQALDAALAQHDVVARTARTVRDLYEQLWDTPPAAANPGEARGITLARHRAAKQSWAPPMAWDDDTIDDPDALPAHLIEPETGTPGIDEVKVTLAIAGQRPGNLTRAERWVAVEHLAAQGLSDLAIAQRLGVSDKTILRDRQDLGLASTWRAA